MNLAFDRAVQKLWKDEWTFSDDLIVWATDSNRIITRANTAAKEAVAIWSKGRVVGLEDSCIPNMPFREIVEPDEFGMNLLGRCVYRGHPIRLRLIDVMVEGVKAGYICIRRYIDPESAVFTDEEKQEAYEGYLETGGNQTIQEYRDSLAAEAATKAPPSNVIQLSSYKSMG